MISEVFFCIAALVLAISPDSCQYGECHKTVNSIAFDHPTATTFHSRYFDFHLRGITI
jgi:hypothetical protein